MQAEEILQNYHLLGALTADERRTLLAQARTRSYSEGKAVFRRGDPGDGLYGVLTGRIVVVVESGAGKELILNSFVPGEFFGEIALLDGKGRTATALAREPTTLLFLARSTLLPFIEERPKLAVRMIAFLCERLRRTTDLVEDSAFLGVAARLAKQLLELTARSSERGGESAHHVHVSQAELAHMIGVSREAVSKQLSLWREAGVIRVARGRVIVERRTELEAFVNLSLNRSVDLHRHS